MRFTMQFSEIWMKTTCIKHLSASFSFSWRFLNVFAAVNSVAQLPSVDVKATYVYEL